MAKSSRTLSGAAKDRYFERVLESEPELDDGTRERLLARLTTDVALVALKAAPRRRTPAAGKASSPLANGMGCTEPRAVRACEPPPVPSNAESDGAFDPYSPNVIVVIRTQGRDAVMAELHGIADVDRLRLLAREQQLGIEPGLSSADEIRSAIVAAAERRIANRRAAAS